MRSNFPAARRHLEDAFHLLPGDDDLSTRSRQALEILIDAFLADEFSTQGQTAKVIDFSERRRQAGGLR